MSWSQFLFIFAVCALTMLVCRVIPVFALKERELPESVSRGLGFIPPAAFAALVVNDLFDPEAIASGIDLYTFIPYIASLVVVIVAVKTKSLLWCIIVGLAVYAVLLLAVPAVV